MQLTNTNIENSFAGLSNWKIPSSIPYKPRMRLIRNHRKLTASFNEKEQFRIGLAHTHVKDGSQKPDKDSVGVVLTPDEHLKFQPEYIKLMSEVHDVDIHPQEIYSSREGHKPIDPDFAIDLDKLEAEGKEIPTNVMTALLDVILFDPGDPVIREAMNGKPKPKAVEKPKE